MILLLKIAACFFVGWIISKLLERNQPLIYSHYTQPTGLFYLKRWLIYLYLRFFVKRKILLPPCNLKDVNAEKPALDSGLGLVPCEEEEEIERNDDAVEFFCSDSNGNIVIAGVDKERDDHCYFYVHHSDLQTLESTSNRLSAIGLDIQQKCPFRKWKIVYNGFLRKQTADELKDQVLNGKLKLLWTPSHQEIINSKDHRNDWLLAKAIAKENWTWNFFKNLKHYKSDGFHEQWGMLEGKCQIAGKDQEIHLILRGKKRRTKRSREFKKLHKKIVIDLYVTDGTVIHFSSESFKNGLTENSYGYVIFCDEIYQELNDCNFSLPQFAENKVIPQKFDFTLTTNIQKYDVKVKISTTQFRLIEGSNNNEETIIHGVDATVDGYKANGFLRITFPIHNSPLATTGNILKGLKEVKVIERTLLAVPLTDINCRDGDFVGGKAMSLGLMTTINSDDFIIPKGLCLTVSAYLKQLNANPKIPEMICNLQKICVKSNLNELQKQCESVTKAIANTEVNSLIKEAVKSVLENLFGQSVNDHRFAVRSSAVGEDGDETSSAGQNETFLGVKGLDMMHEAISKCWASQFAFQAVQYRRQHGQLINCGMGVVIQEMVNSQVAGVLFTREPVDGNITKMLITANYGLGESVVSSLCDPDTIYINRNWRDELRIQEKNLGQKKSIITLNDSESGTKDMESSEEQMSSCCLSDDQALHLAKIGIFLENVFKGPRDIEWAFSNGKLHLLQSRAITNVDRDDEWWIANELNTAPIGDEDVNTMANLGEVLPGSLTPLSLTLSQALFDIVVKTQRSKLTPTSSRFVNRRYFSVFGTNCFLNLTSVFSFGVSKKLSSRDIGSGHSLLGCDIFSGGLHKSLLHRHQNAKPRRKLVAALPALEFLFNGCVRYQNDCKKALETAIENFQFKDGEDANQIFRFIRQNITPYFMVTLCQMATSGASTVFQGILIAILTSKSDDFTTEHLSDIATLLSDCSNIESADVPTAIQKIVNIIADLPEATKQIYKDSTAEDVLKLLKNDSGKLGREFKAFLDNHGHRGYREMELHATTWAKDPISLIKAIQLLLKSSSCIKTKSPLTIKEIINSLKTPIKPVAKMIMRFILKKSKEMVSFRERIKSNMAMITDVYRKAFWKLGEKMVEEGRFLDPELIFFLTYYEIDQFLQTRSPKLLAKALQRQTIRSKLERLQFPALIYGYPKLKLEEEEEEELTSVRKSDIILKATCASRGKCRGIARVVRSIRDADIIQSGDILITHSTDICWSPYFPLLSGIVTEIGGLISHGAVVAREYGLPCLIAAENATKIFRSGDEVLLDAARGTIELIAKS